MKRDAAIEAPVRERVSPEEFARARDQQLPAPVHIRKGVGNNGKTMRYYLNYSSGSHTVTYSYPDGVDLLTDKSISHGGQIVLAPWDVAVVEER